MTPPSAKPRSLWLDTTPGTEYPRGVDTTVDVAIAGGGLAGITAAYLLKKAELTVAVLERDRIGSGQTAQTTAHLTWILDQPIAQLRKDHGAERAARVLEAHHGAIEEIERIATTLGIDCDFERVTAWRYGIRAGHRRQLERDVAVAREFGRACEYVPPEQVPVPAPGGAMRVPDQAKFHPRKYLLGLAAHVEGEGSHIFERSLVEEAVEMRDGWTVRTHDAVIQAKHLILATHSPFGLRPALQTHLEPMQTYALAAEGPRGALPPGLYWDTNDPYQYLRVEAGNAHDVWILGGGDHRTGSSRDTRTPHRALERYLRETLSAKQYTITHEWSGQVLEPDDGIAFIGRYPGRANNRWVATGFSGNGMTYSTIAGILLRDRVLGVDNAWAGVFDPARIRARASAAAFLRANATVVMHLVAGRLEPSKAHSLDDVPVGEGRIVYVEGRKLAVYRDEPGQLSAMSPVCTHTGCIVDWNEKAKTWDCPCHGSRYAPTGEVDTGPATAGLHPVELPSPAGAPARVK
jgi:glycine/D-amino acid oxidase-like deaminating enzyme/nitrite reductase/ring-hydroxylating ferredoxin subunit